VKFPRCKLAVEFDLSLLPSPIEQTYQGRYQALRDEVNIGIEASDRGDVVDTETVFSQLKERLNQRRNQPQ
jgi:antitoxin ParD1/3/4